MPKTAAHLTAHQIKPGQVLNPAGRPKGSRHKLQELAVALLHEDFVTHGAEVIRKVRERKPEVYLASVVSLLPRRTEKNDSPLVDISDDELAQLTEHLKAIRAKTVKRMLRLDPGAVSTTSQPQPQAAPAQPRSPDQPLPNPDAPGPKPQRQRPDGYPETRRLSMWESLEGQQKSREEKRAPSQNEGSTSACSD